MFFSLIPGLHPVAWSQIILEGKVLAKHDKSPISYATIGIRGKNAGTVADSKGRFRLYLSRTLNQADTIVFSSIGFSDLGIPGNAALKMKEFELEVKPRELLPVSVYTLLRKHYFKTARGEENFFRGWYNHKTGGEIGTVIALPHSLYKLNKIFFKVDNQYDTCLIRLHIREIENDLPAGELLKEEIILPVYRHSIFDDADVFDITDQNLVLTEKELFIGFEIIDCSISTPPPHSLSFIGAEKGIYIFKRYANSVWENLNDFTIYVELGLDF